MNEKRQTNDALIVSIFICILILCIAVFFLVLTHKKMQDQAKEEEMKQEKIVESEPEETPQPSSRPLQTLREPLTQLNGDGTDTVTVMVYLNGSNLESDYGSATTDVEEMLQATGSEQVNVVIQTVSTREWQDYDIASDRTQRYEIQDHDLVLVDDSLDQMDCTEANTLSDFLVWSQENYPADRYMLILWNHGGGPVEGFGYNEWGRSSDSLTINEMQDALETSGIKLDIFGMDCCIMSSLEVCYALYDYCDYMILSEDFESSLGWAYEGWLTALAENPSIDTPALGEIIIDDMVAENDRHAWGSSSTLALIDQRYVPDLYASWKEFAYANEESLLNVNYSREIIRSARALPFDVKKVDSEMQEYYITDIMALASSISSDESKPLITELTNAIVYYNCTDDNLGLTGLSITIPYGDRSFYSSLRPIYLQAGFEKDYITWLSNFTSVDDTDYYNYDDFNSSWSGWEEEN